MKKMREELSQGQMPEGVPAQLLAQVEQLMNGGV